jgi:anti-sigma B factor antagonist
MADNTQAFSIHTHTQGTTVVLRVHGSLDMVSAPDLEQHIARVLREHPAAVVVDLTDVDFLASAGMNVLIHAYDAAAGRSKLAVVADGQHTSRPMRIIGVDQMIDLYPTMASALRALAE